jgi:hypothetical protein
MILHALVNADSFIRHEEMTPLRAIYRICDL